MPKIVYATGNSGKVLEVSRHLQPAGWEVIPAGQVAEALEIEESGSSLEENVLLKAHAHRQIVPTDFIVFADDTGLEIDALNGEPGIYVRRWRDRMTEMTDQELIDYTLERMQDIPASQRQAQFRTVIAIIWPDGREALVSGVLRGEITQEAAPIHIPGLPFEGLFYVPEWGQLLGDTRQLSAQTKIDRGYISHREKAAEKMVELLAKAT